VGEHTDEPVVLAVVAGFVVAVAGNVSDRVDGPGDVPDEDGADEDAPDERDRAYLERTGPRAGGQEADEQPAGKINEGMEPIDPEPREIALEAEIEGIAEDVAGVLLEKAEAAMAAMENEDPADVGPEEVDEGRMGVGLAIGMAMVQAMDGHPAGRGVLEAADAEQGEGVLKPLGDYKALVGEDAVVAERDAEQAVDVVANEREQQAPPTEDAGDEREEAEDVDGDNVDEVAPFDLHGLRGLGPVEPGGAIDVGLSRGGRGANRCFGGCHRCGRGDRGSAGRLFSG